MRTIKVGSTIIVNYKLTNIGLKIGDIGVVNYIKGTNLYVTIKNKYNQTNVQYGYSGDYEIDMYDCRLYDYTTKDKVLITSKTSKFKGKTASIVHYSKYDDCVYCLVDGESANNKIYGKMYTCRLVYDSVQLLIDGIHNNKGENKMNKLAGYNKVALIKLDNVKYAYALYDESIIPGDNVLVSGRASGKVHVVDEVLNKNDENYPKDINITAEIMCKVDLTAYNKRVENRKLAEELRKEMDKKIAEMDELNKYVMYAERCPELAEMFNKYKELI